MFRKLLSTLASAALIVAGLTALSAPAQANQSANARISATESRSLSLGTNFRAEADEFSANFTISLAFTSQQYADIGPGRTLTFRAALKNGSSTVSRERNVYAYGAINAPATGNSFLTNSNVNSLTVEAYLDGPLLSDVDYQLSVEVFENGILLAAPAAYTVGNVTGNFSKLGPAVTTTGEELNLNFQGTTCLSADAYTTLQAGDVIELSVSDPAANTYSVFANIEGAGFQSFLDNAGVLQLTLTSQMLTDKFAINFRPGLVSPVSGTFTPTVSVKKQGSSTELSVACATAPSAAPTVVAAATGLSVAVDLDGASGASCFLADASHPNVPIAQASTSSFSATPTCFFTGLKRGDYVVWYERFNQLSNFSGVQARGVRSPLSLPVTYAGGNSTYRTFTGTTGGSGQGSLTLTNIDYVGSDFGTETRASDGNGGVLVGTIDAPANQYKLRQLTTSGMNSTFGGSGEVTVDLPLYNQRSIAGIFGAGISLGWYGTQLDKKWIAVLPSPAVPSSGGYGGFQPSGAFVLATGDFSGANQVSSLVGNAELAKFCSSAVTGTDNTAVQFGSGGIRQIVSSPVADPLLIVDCEIRRGSGPYFYSQLPFLVSFNGTDFVVKAQLGEEPTSAEPCSRTMISAANSGASGAEVMLATYQVTWLPASGDCYFMSNLPSSSVVSRDVFTIASDYTRTQHQSVLTVGATDEPGVSHGSSSGSGWRLIVSGTNTHLLASEVSGVMPNQRLKYRVARLVGGSFGILESLPYMTVANTTEFSTNTTFSQIADYSETEADSFLLSRADFSTGSTAARVDLTTGALTSYQQMASTFGSDGGSLILGNSTGALNFYGITSRTTAVLGEWVTAGAFDEALASLPINQGASNTGVTPSNPGPPPPPGQTSEQPGVTAAPFNGPIVDSSKIPARLVTGKEVTLSGTNLSGVSKVEINGLDAKVTVNPDGTLKITIPSGLPAGTYDLVLTSSQGKVTIQNAIVVTSGAAGEVRPSTKMVADNTLKVWVFEAAGAGKVQIKLNGQEVAWVNALSADDPKLRDGYLVRTLTLAAGKNVIEVYVDGERVSRRVATGS